MILVSEVSWAKSDSKGNRGQLEVQPHTVNKHHTTVGPMYAPPRQEGTGTCSRVNTQVSAFRFARTAGEQACGCVIRLHSLTERMTRGSILTFYSHLFILVYLSNKVIKHSRTFVVIGPLSFSIKH